MESFIAFLQESPVYIVGLLLFIGYGYYVNASFNKYQSISGGIELLEDKAE